MFFSKLKIFLSVERANMFFSKLKIFLSVERANMFFSKLKIFLSVERSNMFFSKLKIFPSVERANMFFSMVFFNSKSCIFQYFTKKTLKKFFNHPIKIIYVKREGSLTDYYSFTQNKNHKKNAIKLTKGVLLVNFISILNQISLTFMTSSN